MDTRLALSIKIYKYRFYLWCIFLHQKNLGPKVRRVGLPREYIVQMNYIAKFQLKYLVEASRFRQQRGR